MPFIKGSTKPKTGGRQKGTPNRKVFDAAEMCERLNYNPLEALAELAKTTRDEGIKVACHKEVAKYVFIQKRSTEVSGPGGGAIEVESSDVKELLDNFKSLMDTKLNERKGG